MGVAMLDGQISFTRTPCGASCASSVMAKPWTPPLLAPYASEELGILVPASDARSNTTGCVAVRRCGRADLTVRNVPFRFTSSTLSKVASSSASA